MNEFVERLGWVLVHSLWQFALVALLAGMIVRTMRRCSAALRYVALVAAMAVSVATPVVTWVCSPNEERDDFASRTASTPGRETNEANSPEADTFRLADCPVSVSDAQVDVPAPDIVPTKDVTESQTVISLAAPTKPVMTWSERATSILRPWLAWLVAGWSLGVVLCSLRPLLGWHTLWRLKRVGIAPVSGDVQAMMARVSHQIGLHGAVRVLQSTLAQVPIVVGYFRPVILLPLSLVTSIPASQLEAILAHELAHVRRHDFVVNLLQTLVETLFFYHPAVWWLSQQVRVEREHCCDDLVVTLLGNRVEYGRALLAIEEQRGQSTLLALGATDGSLLTRVRRIVSVSPDRLNDRWSGAFVGFVTIGLVLTIAFGTFVSSRAEVVPNAGRGSPDSALNSTEGLPKSDDGQSKTDNTNGDLRSTPAAGSADPRRAQVDTSLADAVRDFNAENKRLGIGLDQPPLTEDEVVAAIKRGTWKDEIAPLNEKEIESFKAVAESRRLPKEFFLQVFTNYQPEAFIVNHYWQIQLSLPAVDHDGFVRYTIRNTKFVDEKIDPKSVAWGKPDADGLSLGVYLSPKKDKYQIGERVHLRLFVRNDGQRAVPVTWPNTSHPMPEVTDETGAKVAVRIGHDEWNHKWISGFVGGGALPPGAAHAFTVPFEIRIGGEGNKLIGRVIEARPGQTLKLKVREPNGNHRKPADNEPIPESGIVTFAVIAAAAADAVDPKDKAEQLRRDEPANIPNNRPQNAAVPANLGTLSGRFIFDGEPPAPKDLYPQFAKLEPRQSEETEVPGRTVEGLYREFLKHGIRPKTIDQSLPIGQDGGIANVLVWVTSKEIPWTPPTETDWPIATVRFQDGRLSPLFTAITVGQPLRIENYDPVKATVSIDFQRALNPTVDAREVPAPKSQSPLLITARAPENWPVGITNGRAAWSQGSVFVHRNGFFAVSQADGSFKMPNLPPGEWEFRAWHDRSGFLPYWPEGRFKQTIKSGDNNLGTIKLKREHFPRLIPANEATTPPPQNREQIGEVLGKPVYRDQIKGNNLAALFFAPVRVKYTEAHRAEMTPTEAEFKFAAEYFERTFRERMESDGGEAKKRDRLEAIKTQLADGGLSDAEEQKLENEYRNLKFDLDVTKNAALGAAWWLTNWKAEKHIYDTFGGGRVLVGKMGHQAFDATRTFMETLEKQGEFKITDPALRVKLYEPWTRDRGNFLKSDKEEIRRLLLEPEYVAPAKE